MTAHTPGAKRASDRIVSGLSHEIKFTDQMRSMIAGIISEETGDLVLVEALEAIAQGRSRSGNEALLAFCDQRGLRTPITHSDLLCVVARAALAKVPKE